jgi:hypothetical protein
MNHARELHEQNMLKAFGDRQPKRILRDHNDKIVGIE